MTDKLINPEVIKAAAEMAFPDRVWAICQDQGYFHGKPVYANADSPPQNLGNHTIIGGHFNPIEKNTDAWALERTLKKEGFRFWYTPTKFCAQLWQMHADLKAKPVYQDESDTLLLLKVVAQIKRMELYL
jgi:hypothetical protein